MEDVDLFASSYDKDGQHEDNEVEEELLTAAKSSTAPLSTSNVKGFSIFSTDDNEDDNAGDMNNLFIPAGADEGKKIDIDVEDNSKLLESVKTQFFNFPLFLFNVTVKNDVKLLSFSNNPAVKREQIIVILNVIRRRHESGI